MMEWYELNSAESILSPALLFYPERIRHNIDQMIKAAGTADRLRPHVKTYKCREIIQMQVNAGISKFKCATLKEAELLGETGVKDILVAYPLVGPSQKKFLDLVERFPSSKFSVLVDHEEQLIAWKKLTNQPINLFIDLDVGMHRTGISPEKAFHLYQLIRESPFIFCGLQVYDGHIRESDLNLRKSIVDEGFQAVDRLIDKINADLSSPFEIVCGGSITFPIHAQHQKRILSPGTTLLWDYGYSSNFPDLPFQIAVTLLTRIVSKPTENTLCLDLGHKAVASEMKSTPVYFPQIPDAKIVVHSEEHLVIETKLADDFKIGSVLYGIPWHICPTVALHEEALIVKNQATCEQWKIAARSRSYLMG